jgi:hypothetical protein
MSSSYTTRLRLEKQGAGENATTWGTILNTAALDLVDAAVGAVTTIDLAGEGAYTVSSAEGVPDEARSAVLYFTGSCSADVVITVPAVQKVYIVDNETTADGSDAWAVNIKPVGGAGVNVAQKAKHLVYTDGATAFSVFTSIGGVTKLDAITVSASIGVINNLGCVSLSATNICATDIYSTTGSFTTKVSAAALEVSGVVSAASAVFSAAVCVSTIYGDGSNLSGISAAPTNYLTGLQLSNDTDAEHDISVAAGTARDTADEVTITLDSAMVKRIDASWASGTGNGGLATTLTLAADTWYHMHGIVVGGAADVGFDTSPTAATLVAQDSATAYRRIGSVYTDGSSNIRAFKQTGDKFLYENPILSYTSVNIGSTARTTISLQSPVSVSTEAIFSHLQFGFFTRAQYAYRPLSMTDVSVVEDISNTAPTSAAMGTLGQVGAGYVEYGDDARIRDFVWEGVCKTNLAGQIGVRTQVTGGSADGGPKNSFQTTGWYDSRGKDG